MAEASPRYHSLDSLRASMMLLGIYLHVVVGYSGNGSWPYIDKNPTHVLDWTLGVIHGFRMPAFFAMAGFFGALLWNTRGPRSFLDNRLRRIALPFLLFWTFMFPLVYCIVVTLQYGGDKIVPSFLNGDFFRHLHPMHMWFLEYLLLLYTLGALVAWASRPLQPSMMPALHRAYRWTLQRSYAPVLFAAVLSWGPLTLMQGNLKDVDGLLPEWRILLAYIGPFWFGWMLYHHRDLLDRFRRHVWIYLALSFPALTVYGKVSGRDHAVLRSAGNVLLCWFLIFASIGLFLRYASSGSPRWRYMSDSSYWTFLMHLPVVVALQVAFKDVPLPALAKVPIVLALAIVILVAAYDVLVRPRWLGALLNGRRYPRGLPAAV